MREKFKKGEIVSATRTFNGEIITGEFRGYHLFNDEIPDTVVGIVDVPGDGVYDVDVTSLRHCVKSTRYSDDEDEKIRKTLIHIVKGACGKYSIKYRGDEIGQEELLAYLEKQKDQKPNFDTHWENGSMVYEQKEQKPNIEICPDSETGYPIEDCDYGLEIALDILEKTLGKVQGFQTDDGIREHQTAIKAVKDAMEEQKSVEKPINWTELTWKDINELEGIINNVHYEFRNGIGQESFGKEVLERFRSTKGIEYLDEAEQKYWRENEPKPAERNNATINGEPIPTENQSVDIPLAEWSEEDDEMVEEIKRIVFGAGSVRNGMREKIHDWLYNRLKYLCPAKQEWSEEDNIGWDEAFACVTRVEKAAKNEEELQNAVTAEKWLKEIKFKYSVHPVKEEWSEDDERILKGIIGLVDHDQHYGVGNKEMLAWSKSLRPSWKPSEEQMSMLLAVIRDPNNAGSESCSLALKSIYEQLKKLM